MKNEYLMYGLLFVAVLVLAWTVFSAFSKPQLDRGVDGRVLETASNEQYFQQQAAQSGSECGDLNDEANVQHLSHHPSQYENCLRQVDPAFLKQATGKTYEQIMAA